MRASISLIALVVAACGPARPATSSEPALPPCADTRVLIVQNGGDEGVIVYARNGRTSTEIGAAPIGRKEITVPASVRATSFYAVALSRNVFSGSAQAAPVETRVVFTLECRR
jgi:hypothetical protein